MNFSKSLETGANFATIALAGVLGWAVIHGGIARPVATAAAPARQAPAPKVGMDLSHSRLGINWATNGRTLLIGMQTTCHFCTDSAPFFQKLAASSKNTRIVAVLPQSIEDSKQYLAKLAVRADDLKSSPLSEIAVAGTPTMLLVDGKGIVKNVWAGKIPDEQQQAVLSAIEAKE